VSFRLFPTDLETRLGYRNSRHEGNRRYGQVLTSKYLTTQSEVADRPMRIDFAARRRLSLPYFHFLSTSHLFWGPRLPIESSSPISEARPSSHAGQGSHQAPLTCLSRNLPNKLTCTSGRFVMLRRTRKQRKIAVFSFFLLLDRLSPAGTRLGNLLDSRDISLEKMGLVWC